MVDHIKRQLAAQGASSKPDRPSGHGAGERRTGAKKTTKTDHSDELTKPQIQAARRQAVGYGHRADTNTTFGIPVWVRTYRLLSEEEASRLDEVFEKIVNEANPNKP